DEFLATACKRLSFLARKLIADLSSGEKLFVFKITDRHMTDDELIELRRAMRSYGHNTLLYVKLTDSTHSNGSVECVDDGLIIGHIDRFYAGKNGEDLGHNYNAWVPIIWKARSVWKNRV